MTGDCREYWQKVYESKAPTEVSWYQPVPRRSMEFIRATGLAPGAAILDVGGGASTLVDHLLAAGFTDVTVLDVAPAALEAARRRVEGACVQVRWVVADVTAWHPDRRYDLWHDRAALHFLTEESHVARYVEVLRRALAPGGHVVIAGFGPDGPRRCSGLEVRRYSANALSALLGPTFRLERSVLDEHPTPAGEMQQFVYGWWRAEA